ncbi:hypothetical protein GF376_02040 [Candidatus Peregrinibacteria bacterium]|nr:hypothetical protein [Candidatus Peregrinibacteria bacterium]
MDNIQAEEKFNSVIEHKNDAVPVHQLFSSDFFVGIGIHKDLHIFELEETTCLYHSSVQLPMDVPVGTRAAFPIESLKDYCCIITPECLVEPAGYVSILHEMVHCHQGRTCELELKNTLQIHQKAVQANDYMWELNHQFPYSNLLFRSLIENVSGWSAADTSAILVKLKSELSQMDYEYMIWQIWKEGFARFTENIIRRSDSLPENVAGNNSSKPDRQSLYYVGDFIWRQLKKKDRNLVASIGESFGIILNMMAV